VSRKNVPNAARRAACEAAGAAIGKTVRVQCASCAFVGEVDWRPDYAYWPMVSGLEFDHIVPLAAGGPNVADNLQLLCRPCNRSKGAKTHATHQDDQA